MSKIESDFFKELIKTSAKKGVECFSDTVNAKNADTYFFYPDYYESNGFHRFLEEFRERISKDSFSSVFFICGDAGVGKSTFINQFISGNINKLKKETKIFAENSIVIDFNLKNTECSENQFNNKIFYLLLQELKLKHLELQIKYGDSYIHGADIERIFETNEIDPLLKVTQIILNFFILAGRYFDWGFLFVFDNIDLCSVTFQHEALKFLAELNSKINQLSKGIKEKNNKNIRFIMTSRKDTIANWRKFDLLSSYTSLYLLQFPAPQIYKIVQAVYEKAVLKTLKDELKKDESLNFEDINLWLLSQDEGLSDGDKIEKIDNVEKLRDYFVEIVFNIPRRVWRNYMNTEFYAFHNCFVNYDVRKFGLFIFQAIMLEGYSPMDFRVFGNKFTKINYARVIFNGSKKSSNAYVDNNDILVYNSLIKPEESAGGFPICFNLFETYMLSDGKGVYYEDVFLIYIRILQFLWREKVGYEQTMEENDGTSINVKKVLEELESFFDKLSLERALRFLIYTGVLIETKFSSRNYVNSVNEIILSDEGEFAEVEFQIVGNEPKSAGALYLSNIVLEYEYIAFHSEYYVTNFNSALRNPRFNRNKIDYIEKADKFLNIDNAQGKVFDVFCGDEYNVVRFLTAMYFILEYNMQTYRIKKCILKFKDIFRDGRYGQVVAQSPWKRMSESVLKTLEIKIQSARQNAEESDMRKEHYVQRGEHLSVLYSKYKEFMETGNNKFEEMLASIKKESDDITLTKDEIQKMLLENMTLENIASRYGYKKDNVLKLLMGEQ